MANRHIAIVSPRFLDSATAPSRRAASAASFCRENGWDVTMICNGPGPSTAGGKGPSNGLDLHTVGFRIESNRWGLFHRLLSEVRFGVAAIRRIRALESGSRVLISVPPVTPALIILVLRIVRRHRLMTVLDVRDLYPEVLVHAGVVSAHHPVVVILRWMFKAVYRRSDKVTVATRSIAEVLRREYGCDHVDIWYNGVPKAMVKTAPRTVKPPLGDQIVLVTHGTMGYFQDVSGLVDLARTLRELGRDKIQIRVAGDGPKRELVEQAESLGLPIKYLGLLKPDEVATTIDKATIGLSLRTTDPGSEGALPVRMFEYLGRGIPVIVVPDGEAGHYVTDAQAGLVLQSFDSHAVVRAVDQITDSQATYQSYCNHALELGLRFVREERLRPIWTGILEDDRF